MSAKAAAARALLRESGIDPDAPDEPALAARLGAPDGDAVAHALGEVGGERAAAVLRALEPTLPSRPAVKAVRRALRRLAQRGIAVPPPVRAPARPPLAATGRSGLVSAIDGGGDRLIWLLRERPGGTLLLVAAHLNEPGGLRELHVADVRRGELRRGRDRLQRESGFRLIEAPFEVLDALVLEAWERAHPEGPGADYPRIRTRLTAAPPAPPAEPHSARLAPLAGDETDHLVADSAAVAEEPELAAWGPRPDEAASTLAELEAAESSPLVVGPDATEQRRGDIVRRAIETLVAPEVMARRLEGTAYVLAETGRVEPARRALAVATRLRAQPDAVADVPLVAALVGRTLARALAQRRATHAAERRDALVLTPDEVRARSSSRRARTPD